MPFDVAGRAEPNKAAEDFIGLDSKPVRVFVSRQETPDSVLKQRAACPL